MKLKTLFFAGILTAGCFLVSAPDSHADESYKAQVKLMKKNSAKKPDPARTQDFERGIQELAESGILEKAVKKGDAAPDFTLPDIQGNPVTLSELLKKGPVVLVWYRGGWCPYCNLHLQTLQNALPDFQAAGAQLVAVSPELPAKTEITSQKHTLGFPVLSDQGNKTASAYGLVFTLPDYVSKRYHQFFNIEEYNGDKSETLPLSASYVIGQDGKVTYAFLDADYKKRAEPKTLIKKVKKLQRKAA